MGSIISSSHFTLSANRCIFILGVYCCFLTATTQITALSTWSMALMPTPFRMAGAAVCSFPWFSGTPTTQACTLTTRHTTASPKRKAIGDSQDLWSTAECSMFLGKAAAVRCARMKQPTSPRICDWLKMRRVFYGTTLSTTTPKRRRDTLDSRTKELPATSTLFCNRSTSQMLSVK